MNPLLEDIITNPEEDEPRLVYADWLLEQGEPLGELIQVQIELLHQPTKKLRARAAELLSLRNDTLIDDEMLVDPIIRRGFVEGGTVDLKDVLDDPAIFERYPLLRELEVFTGDASKKAAMKFVRSPLIGRLHSLKFRHARQFDAPHLRALAANEAAASLRAFGISGASFGARGVRALTESTLMLEDLEIGSEEIGPDGAAAIGSASFRDRLTRLSLWKTEILTEGVAALEGLPALVDLDLTFNAIDASGVNVIATALGPLRTLILRGNRFGDAGAAALEKLDPSRLERLNVRSTGISAPAARKLAKRLEKLGVEVEV